MFKDSDFKNMRWNAKRAVDEKALGLTKDVPIANNLRSHRFEVMKYLCFMYDVGSPLPKRIQNIMERKEMAVKLAGIERTDISVVSMIEHLFRLSVPLYKDILAGMLRIQKNRKFSQIVALEQLYDQCINAMIEPFDGNFSLDAKRAMDALNAKRVTAQMVTDIDIKLEALYASVYYEDDTDANVVVDTMLKWTPESTADEII